ncbi:MAG: sulfate adenylyltransferase subunit 1, partial [Burkholderiales bacterium]
MKNIELLRFITAGSVDDGKSTLIGRLLHDSKSIFEDQLCAIEKTTKRRGLEGVDLSLLTDGLQAEREQGITIDVAYRYFATPKRKFIIADTPGHEQYTRNMVTGASTANLAIILIDARRGVLTQTRRHAYLASLVGIPHLVVAVNKMDLVGYSKEVFESIVGEFGEFASGLNLRNIIPIPISALAGDNVVERGSSMPWYDGETLLEVLENIEIDHDINMEDFRFPVQWICRPQTEEWHDFRGYMGRIESGSLRIGDAVTVLPSGRTSRVRAISTFDGNLVEAVAPQSVTLLLEDE